LATKTEFVDETDRFGLSNLSGDTLLVPTDPDVALSVSCVELLTVPEPDIEAAVREEVAERKVNAPSMVAVPVYVSDVTSLVNVTPEGSTNEVKEPDAGSVELLNEKDPAAAKPVPGKDKLVPSRIKVCNPVAVWTSATTSAGVTKLVSNTFIAVGVPLTVSMICAVPAPTYCKFVPIAGPAKVRPPTTNELVAR
jgi:hypothetical protein